MEVELNLLFSIQKGQVKHYSVLLNTSPANLREAALLLPPKNVNDEPTNRAL